MATNADKKIDVLGNQENLPVVLNEIIEGKGVTELLMDRIKLDAIVAHVKKEATSEVCDATTEEGRKRLRSIAAAISSSKTLFEKPMANSIRIVKAQPKVMTENKTHFVGCMDALRDLVRKPSDDWQDAQDLIAKAKQDVIDCFGLVVANAREQLPNMLPATALDQIKVRIADVEVIDISAAEDRIEEAKTAKQDCLLVLAGYLSYAEKEVQKAEQAEADRITEIKRVAKENAIKDNAAEMRRLELDRNEAIQQAEQERADAERRVNVAAQQARDEQKAIYAKQQQEAAKPAPALEEISKERISEVRNLTGAALCGLGLTVDQAKVVMTAAANGELHGLQMVY
jgi:colicin import membrane protein